MVTGLAFFVRWCAMSILNTSAKAKQKYQTVHDGFITENQQL
jgi:hypothetical protein